MKVAIFHNFMDNIGGAEMVCLRLAEALKADIYTTNLDKEKIKRMGFKGINIISIGKVPINAPFKHQLALRKFRKLNLKNKYDLYIIGGDWAISGAVKNKPNLWYIHSPMRELYDMYPFIRKNRLPFYLRPIYDVWVIFNRVLVKKCLRHVSKILCNSNNTQKRIEKYLKKNAEVIYPPIETSKFYYGQNKGFWLSVNRLFVNKRVEIQTKAFEKMPDEKLIIVGSYEQSKHFRDYAGYINQIKPKNVEIQSWVDDRKLKELYANCKGFITTSQDEDFGMTPVEAMASGKPVIAPKEGGYKETVINGKTGILIDDINENKLAEAIKKIGKEIGKNPLKYKKSCQRQAKKFDTSVFIKKIKKQIREIIDEKF